MPFYNYTYYKKKIKNEPTIKRKNFLHVKFFYRYYIYKKNENKEIKATTNKNTTYLDGSK